MNIGNNIKKLRKEKHLSQEELAQKCNVSRQTISRWESNEVLPDTNNLIILAKLFNVTLDEIVFGVTEQKKRENKSIIGKACIMILLAASLVLNIILFVQRHEGTNDPSLNLLQGEYIYQPEDQNYHFILNVHDNNIDFDVYLHDRWSEAWSWKGSIDKKLNIQDLYVYEVELKDDSHSINNATITMTYDADKDEITCSFPEQLSLGIRVFTMIRK